MVTGRGCGQQPESASDSLVEATSLSPLWKKPLSPRAHHELKGVNVKISRLAIPIALVATLGAAAFALQGATGAAATAGEPPVAVSSHNRIEATTKQKTYALLHALERQDMQAIRSLTASSVTWSNPMALTGDNDADAGRWVGEDAVIAHFFQDIHPLIDTVDFVDERVTVDGQTSIVEALGDFVTAAGRPYRNVYVFRFDWRDGELVAGVEYLNPMTICWSFQLAICTPPATPPA